MVWLQWLWIEATHHNLNQVQSLNTHVRFSSASGRFVPSAPRDFRVVGAVAVRTRFHEQWWSLVAATTVTSNGASSGSVNEIDWLPSA